MKPLPYGLPRLLTPLETKKALGADEQELQRLVTAGELRCTWTPGNVRRFYADEVEALAEAGGAQ